MTVAGGERLLRCGGLPRRAPPSEPQAQASGSSLNAGLFLGRPTRLRLGLGRACQTCLRPRLLLSPPRNRIYHRGMSQTTKDTILSALRGVLEPNTGKDVVSLGWVRNVAYCDGVARILLQLPPTMNAEPLQRAVEKTTIGIVSKLPALKQVSVEFALPAPAGGEGIPGVRHVIAIGAGKGGVGKSTVAVLTAFGLARAGMKVGILDADVYGPSVPKLTGTENAHPQPADDGRIIPPEAALGAGATGVKIMSMGYLVRPDQPIVWRGPMAQKYVKEFLDRGAWGMLDYLIVDLPPGTGDIPLTLAQSIPLTGAVVVCTPQDVALLDAVKALLMYQKLGVEVFGIVENMSYYVCPHCGQRDEIFSHGGAEQAARRLDVPFLGGIPLNIDIRIHGDAGEPLASFTKTPPYVVSAIEDVVRRIVKQVEQTAKSREPLPTLNIRG